MDRAGISVVIPTIGRPALLAQCLESIAACRPLPAEVVVVDQSDNGETASVVERFAEAGARRVRSRGGGTAVAMNEGLESAREALVLFTHDDVTVDRDWAGTAYARATARPGAALSGSVLPAGDVRHVPSFKPVAPPRDYTGQLHCGVLDPANMVLPRVDALALGGFDERMTSAAEDNDFCYRWLRCGRALFYEPALLVHHHSWRDRAQMEMVYRRYGYGQGEFYAKHLRRGDWRVLAVMARGAYTGMRTVAATVWHREPLLDNPRRFKLPGLAAGLVRGWRSFA